jgi:AraC-like DNA-binding protein
VNATLYRLGAYREYAPPADLRHIVDVVWVYSRPSRAHRVLPEGGVSLCFQSRRNGGGVVSDPQVTLIGPIRAPRFTDPDPDLHLEAVRLKPEWCRDLLRADPAEHLNAVDSLPSARLLDRLARTTTSREALLILLDEIRSRRAPSPSLAHAGLEIIREAPGAPVHDVARRLRVSERQLRRVIIDSTSWSPKRLQRVLRMNRAVAMADRDPAPNWPRVAAECGYYDQPHLIAELQALTGRSPVQLHAERWAE